MRRWLARRVLHALAIVWAVTTVAFVISNVLPSDPARMVAGPQARPKDVERVRVQLGLDKPILTQYALFLGRLVHVGPSPIDTGDERHASCAGLGPVHVDLGQSYQQRQPVVRVLAERLPRTLALAVASLFVQVSLGIAAGVVAAARRGSAIDRGTVALALVGVSTPTFFLGVGLQFLFAHKLRWLPLDGFGRTVGEHAVSLVLPALTLGIVGAAYYTRLVRDEMVEHLQKDHVRTARAKGLGEAGILTKHALRNALVPLVTLVGMDLGALLGGAVLTEHLFRWPGMGALSVTAILDRDSPLILGVVIVSSCAVVVCTVLVDLAYTALDPRLRK